MHFDWCVNFSIIPLNSSAICFLSSLILIIKYLKDFNFDFRIKNLIYCFKIIDYKQMCEGKLIIIFIQFKACTPCMPCCILIFLFGIILNVLTY